MKRNMSRQQIIDKLNVIAFSSYEYSETAREAISLLIEDETALEKQIPKKPNISLKGTTGWNTKCHCPTCHSMVSHDKFCSECGQALDWSDTE